MASKGYVISVATDSRLFEQGVRMGIIKPVEEADDALTDLGKNKGADQLTDELKDAQRATDKLGDDVRQAAKQMQSDYRKTAQAARDTNQQSTSDFELSTREKTRLSKETIKEVGNEAKQNASETFSSFDGSAQSFVDGIQGTLGGLVGSLGPVGLAIGAAGAIGIGLINGALQKADENSEQFKADVADLTQALIDAGNTGEVSIDRVVEVLKKLATTGDDAGVTLDKLNSLSERSGQGFEDIAQAYAGNSKALRQLIQDGDDHAESVNKQLTSLNQYDDAQRKKLSGLEDEVTAWNELAPVLDQAADKADAAAKADKLYAESGAAAMQAKAARIASIDEAYDDAAGAASDYVNAENGIFDVAKYIDAMSAKAAALDAYKDNFTKAALTLSPEAQQFIQSQGEESAAQFTDAYVKAGPEQQAKLNAIWTTAGKASADSYVGSIMSNLPASIPGPTVVIDDVDTSRLKAQIQQTLNGVTFKVNAAANVRVGNAVS